MVKFKSYYKKLLFEIHPDFFHLQPEIRRQNETVIQFFKIAFEPILTEIPLPITKISSHLTTKPEAQLKFNTKSLKEKTIECDLNFKLTYKQKVIALSLLNKGKLIKLVREQQLLGICQKAQIEVDQKDLTLVEEEIRNLLGLSRLKGKDNLSNKDQTLNIRKQFLNGLKQNLLKPNQIDLNHFKQKVKGNK